MANTRFNRTLSDLFETQPDNPTIFEDPFDATATMESNAIMFQRLIRYAIVVKDHQRAMLNAYYLGYLLRNRATMKEAKRCRKTINKHYVHTSQRIYRLYSILGPEQIYRSRRSTLTTFTRLSENELARLVEEATNIIAGAINLEGEVVTLPTIEDLPNISDHLI